MKTRSASRLAKDVLTREAWWAWKYGDWERIEAFEVPILRNSGIPTRNMGGPHRPYGEPSEREWEAVR